MFPHQTVDPTPAGHPQRFLRSHPMRRRVAIVAVILLVLSGGKSLGATAYRTFYPRQGDRVVFDDLDLSCFESHRSGSLPQTFACGNTASENGPYVRITPTRITIAATSQQILFTVRRDR